MEITVEQALQAMNQWAQQMSVSRADYRLQKLLRATYLLLYSQPTLPGMDAAFVNEDLLRALPGLPLDSGL